MAKERSTLDHAVESARKAYDDGYRIIAGWFNDAFAAWKIDLQIDADTSPLLSMSRGFIRHSSLGRIPVAT